MREARPNAPRDYAAAVLDIYASLVPKAARMREEAQKFCSYAEREACKKASR